MSKLLVCTVHNKKVWNNWKYVIFIFYTLRERERERECVCVCVWERERELEREEEERAVDRIFLSVFNEKLEDVPGWEQRYGTPACQDSNVNVPLPGTWRWTGFTCRCKYLIFFFPLHHIILCNIIICVLCVLYRLQHLHLRLRRHSIYLPILIWFCWVSVSLHMMKKKHLLMAEI